MGSRDTSVIRRTVARQQLLRESSEVRAEALTLLVEELRTGTPGRQNLALGALGDFGPAAKVAVGQIVALARGQNTNLRYSAIRVLGQLGSDDPAALEVLREVAAGPDAGLAQAAASALALVGHPGPAREIFRRMITNPAPMVRLRAAERLGELWDTSGVPTLRAALSDTSFLVRVRAVTALGKLGPAAASAVPDLTRMLSDTLARLWLWPSPGDGDWESPAALAAWAIARILPTRSSGGGVAIEYPVNVQVEGGHSLRNDGLGVYAWGVDSVVAARGVPLALMLSGYERSQRGPIGRMIPGFRRSLAFDLTRPVGASGAVSRGVVEDNEAYIWIWRGRNAAGHQTSFSGLTPSDSSYSIARIEMHFRINGVLHELQMGPMVEGQGGGTAWYTGVHGDGTTMGSFTHPNPFVWVVRTAAGSRARLWSFEDRASPVDRGLYEFSLEMRFLEAPNGEGPCIRNPSSCRYYR
jgi:hypothetical protein